ncbi:hypothetical protein MKEN_00840800 [Mycena kentingensis (nom. inval.)]|nr:hypothetical protein MKEN_00840800 [Mycena kentingensis (nom. inval.)]
MPLFKRILHKLSSPKISRSTSEDSGEGGPKTPSTASDSHAESSETTPKGPPTPAAPSPQAQDANAQLLSSPTPTSHFNSSSVVAQNHRSRPPVPALDVTWEDGESENDQSKPLVGNGAATDSDPPAIAEATPLTVESAPEKRELTPPETAGLVDQGMAAIFVETSAEQRRQVEDASEKDRLKDRVFTAGDAMAGERASDAMGALKDAAQSIVPAIFQHMPAFMGALEDLSKIHPFLQAAYLPFKWAYEQGRKDHENDQLRVSVFESMRDTMLVIVEVDHIGTQVITKKFDAPDGDFYRSRVEVVCEKISRDIKAAWNILHAMKKQGHIHRFFKAGDWQQQLAEAKVKFREREHELRTALQIRELATGLETKDLLLQVMAEFKTYRTAMDIKMEQVMTTHSCRTRDEALENEEVCLALLKLEDKDAVGHAGTGKPTEKLKTTDRGPERHVTDQRVEDLRRQLRVEVGKIIQDNLKEFSITLNRGLDQLRQELRDMKRGVDSIEEWVKSPAERVSDEMMRHIWRDQAFRGSAETRKLVHALRDYLAEQCDVTPSGATRRLSHVAANGPVVKDEDKWVFDYLEVQRLQRLQEVLDPDASGRSSIAEVNMFVKSIHLNWSLPRWISYWAIGWQIYATRYCSQIEETFNQMQLLRTEIGFKMPGNRHAVDSYFSWVWQIVTGLTSGVQRFEGTERLAGQFNEYIDAQENKFMAALKDFNYDIDSLDRVRTIAGEPAEQWILMLMHIILRRHLAKMHLCLRMEMNDEEFEDDTMTVQKVAEAGWWRYIYLRDHYKHQRITNIEQSFEWFSCGLFKNYYVWDAWINHRHWKSNIMLPPNLTYELKPVDDEELKGALIHVPGMQPSPDAGPSSILSFYYSPVENETPMVSVLSPPELGPSQDSDSAAGAEALHGPPTKLTQTICESLTGSWFGFFIGDDGQPISGMFSLTLSAKPDLSANTTIQLSGTGPSVGNFFVSDVPETGTVDESIVVDDQFATTSSVRVSFKIIFPSDDFEFKATLSTSLDVMTGRSRSIFIDNSFGGSVRFEAKKAPVYAMCHRPMGYMRPLSKEERLQYALDAVLGRLRREGWPEPPQKETGQRFKLPKRHIARRLGMIKRCLELLRSCETDEERTELAGLRRAFTPNEYMEVCKLEKWYRNASDPHQILICDNCQSPIKRSRVICFDCEEKDEDDTFEFDAKEECVSVETVTKRTNGKLRPIPHFSTHLMVKLRERLMLREYAAARSVASNCVAWAERVWKEPLAEGDAKVEKKENDSVSAERDEQERTGETDTAATAQELAPADAIGWQSFDETEPLSFCCLICHERVTKPCWYCLQCPSNDAWVCCACELQIEQLSPWDYVQRMRKEVGYSQQPPLARSKTDEDGAERYTGKQPQPSFEKTRHNVLHALVRFGNPGAVPKIEEGKKGIKTQEELEELKMELKEQVAGVEKRVQERVAGVEERLERMESLLKTLLDRVK